MVKNGYKIMISENTSVNEYVIKLRYELRGKTHDIAKRLLAKDVEKLWDAKFIDRCEYEKSIFEFAKARINERLQGVANGMFHDGRYDLRSTMNVVKIEKDHIIVLFNTSNKELNEYFETLPEVLPYKYFADLSETDLTEEENNEIGLFWQDQYEACNWKTSLMGLSAQITMQPNLDEIDLDGTDLREYFRDPAERMVEYIESHIVIERVRLMIGNVPIANVSPLALEEFFNEAYKYLKSADGVKEFNKIKEKIECGFMPVDIGSIFL